MTLKTIELSKIFTTPIEVHALVDFEAEILENQITGLLGSNGSGKTTLIKLLTYLLNPSSGKIQLDLKKNEFLNETGLILEGKGFVNERLSLVENSMYNSGTKGKSFDRDFFLNVCSFFEFSSYDLPIQNLSSGNKTKSFIINCLSTKPTFIILDEPTLGLDINATSQLIELIKSYFGSIKPTILISSHDLGFIERICSQLIFILNGKKLFQGTVNQFQSISGQSVMSIDFVSTDSMEKVAHQLGRNYTIKVRTAKCLDIILSHPKQKWDMIDEISSFKDIVVDFHINQIDLEDSYKLFIDGL